MQFLKLSIEPPIVKPRMIISCCVPERAELLLCTFLGGAKVYIAGAFKKVKSQKTSYSHSLLIHAETLVLAYLW